MSGNQVEGPLKHAAPLNTLYEAVSRVLELSANSRNLVRGPKVGKSVDKSVVDNAVSGTSNLEGLVDHLLVLLVEAKENLVEVNDYLTH